LPAEEIVVGRVGKRHGLAGAFVVENASDDAERFELGAELLVDGEPTRVAESKRAGGRVVIRLDRPVERGATLSVPRASLPPTADGEFYVFELVGFEVEEEGGRVIGRVSDVAAGIANDVLELDSGIALPMVEDCVRQVDLEAGRILVAQGFADPE
jgi:16S rRNA processing protein RimM